MKIRYRVGGLLAQQDADVAGTRSFLLTNRAGSFYYQNWATRYGGWSVFEGGELFHVLSEIRIPAPHVSEIEHHLYAVEQVRNSLRERFFIPFGEQALVYGVGAEQDIDLVLDVHRAYDNREWGRHYDVVVEDGKTVIRFTKTTDAREDKTNGNEEFTFFVVVNAPGKVLGKWEERTYTEDEKRKSPPSVRYVYRAARFRASQIVISASRDRNAAIRTNDAVVRNLKKSISSVRRYAETFAHQPIELCAAGFALDSMVLSHAPEPVMWAGLPWFFQEWGRDEAVCLRALMQMGEFEIVKKILSRLLRAVQADGQLPQKIGAVSRLEAADAAGWLFLRFADYMALKRLGKEEKELVGEKVVEVIERLDEAHTKDGFAWHEPRETWMDTVPPGVLAARSFATIEMQALRLALYRFAHQLTKNLLYKDYEEKLKQRVRERFWNGKMLADGLDDFTTRPNVFLAAYIYPDLLSRDEWVACFNHVLDRLWLDWGGLASIDKSHALFQAEYTGEDNRSYHQGDSWFWVNNIAALVMHRADKKAFHHYITKIYETSKEELLWRGCVGTAAEVSSAKELRSEGCVAQAWSAATFVELWHELHQNQPLRK